MYNSADTR